MEGIDSLMRKVKEGHSDIYTFYKINTSKLSKYFYNACLTFGRTPLEDNVFLAQQMNVTQLNLALDNLVMDSNTDLINVRKEVARAIGSSAIEPRPELDDLERYVLEEMDWTENPTEYCVQLRRVVDLSRQIRDRRSQISESQIPRQPYLRFYELQEHILETTYYRIAEISIIGHMYKNVLDATALTHRRLSSIVKNPMLEQGVKTMDSYIVEISQKYVDAKKELNQINEGNSL